MKKILLVGASGGIGHEVARQLLENGYEVFGTYFRHSERVEDLKHFDNFTAEHLDITDIDSVRKILSLHFEERKPNLFAVINCEGIIEFEGNGIEDDIQIWQKTIAINLSGNYYLAKIAHAYFQENGRFIMLSSTDSYFGGAITTNYAASKSGVNSLTKSLSLLFQDKKIRVNSIAPGWIVTPMIEGNGDEFLKKVAAINPLKRNGKPQDVANLISFLLDEKSDYINGQVLSLEGGYTNQDPTLLLEERGQ
ncbi:hypothetical protein COU87_04260 [Candidatus Roizmanbacteria bacterium CG10_big_fil_rev_8_21_14_0_10_39_12]|uniref:Beta-ketoacyl-ACP reductase n=1 Tax=Candidatus Roizmanbacteria bacterium CG10_big_fil_rev_8_21_14_0_10_39_12 TaxID=1974852 RepID=A0A2M8KNI4_9BACT|nr:MAG: hypothetical protein COU87_04260 [Candidatus Roizmanbacteria bacterium CG10_big_fil_rev_8_21_14_0_10_39_12]